MADDISKNVVVILLVLVILVASLGTWAFLSSFQPTGQAIGKTGGDVALKIKAPSTPDEGDVALTIENAEAS